MSPRFFGGTVGADSRNIPPEVHTSEYFQGFAGLFELGRDEEFAGRIVVLNAQDVWLAANLTIFNIELSPAGRLVDGGDVPLSTRGALEAGLHGKELISAG